jgi:mono/diheme cytochrome c family protein
MKKILLVLFTGLVLAISSCYYDKEELLYHTVSNVPCTDTAGVVSYAQKVAPMLQQYCYSCHSGNFPSGNIAMGTYAADKAIGQNGSLYGSINHASGYSPMPQGTPKMSSCQIAVVKKWIDSGMQNN